MAHILAVDDDQEVLGTLSRVLSREGHEVTLTTSTAIAKHALQQNRPDLIILDVMMPNQDGISFCSELRADDQYHSLPILFLSAKVRTDDVVHGLNAGGDDYITKPFEIKELRARVAALLRRTTAQDTQTILKNGDLILNTKTFQAKTDHLEGVQLTSTEFKLLHYLMEHPNHVHSVHDLLDAVWGYPDGSGDPDLVRAHIRNLRVKIEEDSRNPQYISTIHGVGYVINTPDEA